MNPNGGLFASTPREAIRASLRDLFHTDWLPERFEEWMTRYPAGEQLNFVFELPGGKRIYMAGSYPDPMVVETARSARADVTLLQVPPGETLRGREDLLCDLAAASGCRVAVPQHHDPLFRGAPKTDLSGLKRMIADRVGVELRELEPGRWYEWE